MLSSASATTAMVNIPLKRRRHLTEEQSKKLRAIFNKYSGVIDVTTKDDLAREFDVDESWIRMWFCNRRSKAKRKHEMLSPTTENIRPKRPRRRFTETQRYKLEAAFHETDGYIDTAYKHALAREFDVDEASVRKWFEKRRATVRRLAKPTTSLFAHPIQRSDPVAQSPAMEATAAKQSTGNRQLSDLSNLQPEQSIINTGRCFVKKSQSQQNRLPSNPCYKQSHTTEIRKPEADSLSSVAVSLDGRSENTCKGSVSDVNFTGLLGEPKLDKVSNQISVETPYTGIGDKQVSSPLMVYNVQTFSPTAVLRVLPVKENPRDRYDGSHVKKTGTPHLPHERPSTKLRRILPKSAVSPSLSERQGQGHPQYGDGCSNVPSSNEQLRSHSGGMCPPHVPMSTQLPSKSVVDRTQETLVPDKDTFVYEGLPSEITFEPKEHDSSLTNYSRQEVISVDTDEPKEHDSSLTNYSRQEVISVDTDEPKEHDSSLTNYSRLEVSSVDTDDSHTQLPALDKVSFFSAMCEIDTDWTPLPDDVAVMFNSYRESPDCSGGVDITDAFWTHVF